MRPRNRYRWTALAQYNAERARGLVHTAEYAELMAAEQELFDQEMHEPQRCDSSGSAPESPNTASNPGSRYQDTRRTGDGE